MRVLRWPAEPDAQRAGERRFDDARVGARMSDGVAPPRPHRARRRPADHGRADRHQHTRHAGGDEIQQVIEPRCGPTESLVTRRAVTDHRVEGVGAAIDQQRGHAADGGPQQRRHLRVGGVLGDRLDRRARQPVGIERGRVASAQRRQQTPRAIDVVAGQQVGHPGTGAGQRRAAQRDEGRRGGDAPATQAGPRRQAARSPATPAAASAPSSTPVCSAPARPVVGVGEPLEAGGAARRTARPGVRAGDRRAPGRPGSRPRCRPPGRDTSTQTRCERLTK